LRSHHSGRLTEGKIIIERTLVRKANEGIFPLNLRQHNKYSPALFGVDFVIVEANSLPDFNKEEKGLSLNVDGSVGLWTP
jgi:hypothetical protein